MSSLKSQQRPSLEWLGAGTRKTLEAWAWAIAASYSIKRHTSLESVPHLDEVRDLVCSDHPPTSGRYPHIWALRNAHRHHGASDYDHARSQLIAAWSLNFTQNNLTATQDLLRGAPDPIDGLTWDLSAAVFLSRLRDEGTVRRTVSIYALGHLKYVREEPTHVNAMLDVSTSWNMRKTLDQNPSFEDALRTFIASSKAPRGLSLSDIRGVSIVWLHMVRSRFHRPRKIRQQNAFNAGFEYIRTLPGYSTCADFWSAYLQALEELTSSSYA